MYKIGEFSVLSKTTVKTLRFYEKEGLVLPSHIDKYTGYRYYEASQLDEVARVLDYRKIGLSIKEIKSVIYNGDLNSILENRKKNIENEIKLHNNQLQQINNMIKEITMNQEIMIKHLPACTIYYKEGTVKNYSEISTFILESGTECLNLNPGITCVQPDYCYINYLDGEYKEKDIKIRYAQAVVEGDTPYNESDNIKFTSIGEVKAICIYHKGTYDSLGKSYSKIMKHIEENGYEIADFPRECYIDGIWNKDDVNDWLTEIQIPIK